MLEIEGVFARYVPKVPSCQTQKGPVYTEMSMDYQYIW